MRKLRLVPMFALLPLLVSGLGAQTTPEEFARQAQILERDLDDVFAARERARQAVDDLRALNNQLTELLGDLDTPVSEMRRLEGRIATALDRAYQSLQATARSRSQLYDQMEYLAELARGLEQRAPAPISEDNPEGLWRFRLEPIGILALVELEFQQGGLNRALVAVGTYRSSNGSRGALRGSFANGRMALEAIDSRRGKVADLSGVVGMDGRLEGTWRAVASGLDSPAAAGGTFTGHRVASESEVSLD